MRNSNYLPCSVFASGDLHGTVVPAPPDSAQSEFANSQPPEGAAVHRPLAGQSCPTHPKAVTMVTICIAGGGGFIGSHLAKRLLVSDREPHDFLISR